MEKGEYDERLLVCSECDSDFLYSIEEQIRDDKDGRTIPSKCPRCRGGKQPPQQSSKQGGRQRGGRNPGRGRGRARDPFQEEYRSPSFRPSPTDGYYRSPAFASSDPSRQRERGPQGSGGGRSQGRSGSRQRFKITCSKCGRSDTIPFKPSPNRPVFCHECYESQRLEERRGKS